MVGFVIFLTDNNLKGLLLDRTGGGLNLENEVFADINWCEGSLLCWFGELVAEVCPSILGTRCISCEWRWIGPTHTYRVEFLLRTWDWAWTGSHNRAVVSPSPSLGCGWLFVFTVSGYPLERLATVRVGLQPVEMWQLGTGLFQTASAYAFGVREVSVILCGVMSPAWISVHIVWNNIFIYQASVLFCLLEFR